MNKKFCYLLTILFGISLYAMNQEDRKTIEGLLASEVRGTKLDAKVQNNSGYSFIPLHQAAFSSVDADLLEALLKRGADPNVTDIGDTSPLHNAIIVNDNKPGVLLLLQYGADPNMKSIGFFPLNWAVTKGYPDIVKLLIQYKADINIQYSFGTALIRGIGELKDNYFHANKEDLKQCIKILLYYGADPTIRARNGRYSRKNAIDLAQEYGFNDVVKWLQNPFTKEQARKNRIMLVNKIRWKDQKGNEKLLPLEIVDLIIFHMNELLCTQMDDANNDNGTNHEQ